MKRTDRNYRDVRQERWITIVCFGIVTGIIFGILADKYFTPIVEVAEAEVVAPAPVEVEVRLEIRYTKADIQRIIKEKAEKYGVSFEKMSTTVACESGYKADIQSGHTLSYGREESWGVSQWHIPAKNRNAEGLVITKEMALDPYQALDAMAYHFSKGNAKIWTCYRMNYMQ
jgi:hypothetical protein